MVRIGPVSDSGGMMTLTRSPDGRRASTIGFDSSTRRLTVETMRSMVCISCSCEANRSGQLLDPAAALDVDVVGAVDHDLGDGGVLEQRFQHAEAERLVDDPADQRARSPVESTGPSRLMMWPSTRSSRARRSATASVDISARSISSRSLAR